MRNTGGGGCCKAPVVKCVSQMPCDIRGTGVVVQEQGFSSKFHWADRQVILWMLDNVHPTAITKGAQRQGPVKK